MRTAAGVHRKRRGWLLRECRAAGEFWGEAAPLAGFRADRDDWEERIKHWRHGGDPSILGEKGALGFAAWCLRQPLPFTVDVLSARLMRDVEDGVGKALPSISGSTWKIKIGIRDGEAERLAVDRILERVDPSVRFRLDANQSLDFESTGAWLRWMEARPQVEFLEQPMPVGREMEMYRMGHDNLCRLALDESVVVWDDLERILDEGWPGWLVIKPSLFGSPERLFALPESVRCRLVVSSAFESGVGFSFVLQVAAGLGDWGIAHGLGTRGFCGEDGMDGWKALSRFSGVVTNANMEVIWNHAS